MNILGLDISQIADLGTMVAQSGAIRAAAEVAGDEVFEYVIGIAVVIYSTNPTG